MSQAQAVSPLVLTLVAGRPGSFRWEETFPAAPGG
jgi:hypothetical protein